VTSGGPGALAGALLQELRPKQWTKNLLVFAGVLFSQHLTDADLLLRATAGFVAFSLLSGSVYMLNDLKDVEADRRHARKRLRPLAAGTLPVAAVWVALGPLLAAVAAISLWLGPPFLTVVGLYVAFNLAYTFWLKQVVLVDVFMIAILTALVKLGALASIEPGHGALAFSGVVILTMVAAMSFDPKLIWDVIDERAGGQAQARA